MELRAARPVLVTQGGVFHEIQLGLDTGLSKVADYRLGVRPFTIGIDDSVDLIMISSVFKNTA